MISTLPYHNITSHNTHRSGFLVWPLTLRQDLLKFNLVYYLVVIFIVTVNTNTADLWKVPEVKFSVD